MKDAEQWPLAIMAARTRATLEQVRWATAWPRPGEGRLHWERVQVAMCCTDGVLMGSGGVEGVLWHGAGDMLWREAAVAWDKEAESVARVAPLVMVTPLEVGAQVEMA